MFKYIFLISLIFTSINADSFYNSKCVSNFYVENNRIIFEYSDNTTSNERYSQYVIDSLVNSIGLFYYDTSTSQCLLATQKFYGLTEIQFNFLSALTGLLTAFLIVSTILKRF